MDFTVENKNVKMFKHNDHGIQMDKQQRKDTH